MYRELTLKLHNKKYRTDIIKTTIIQNISENRQKFDYMLETCCIHIHGSVLESILKAQNIRIPIDI